MGRIWFIIKALFEKTREIKYWIILSVPLLYFLSQFVTLLLNTFGPLIQADPVLISLTVTLVFTMSKPVGGVLFGIVFWINLCVWSSIFVHIKPRDCLTNSPLSSVWTCYSIICRFIRLLYTSWHLFFDNICIVKYLSP